MNTKQWSLQSVPPHSLRGALHRTSNSIFDWSGRQQYHLQDDSPQLWFNPTVNRASGEADACMFDIHVSHWNCRVRWEKHLHAAMGGWAQQTSRWTISVYFLFNVIGSGLILFEYEGAEKCENTFGLIPYKSFYYTTLKGLKQDKLLCCR